MRKWVFRLLLFVYLAGLPLVFFIIGSIADEKDAKCYTEVRFIGYWLLVRFIVYVRDGFIKERKSDRGSPSWDLINGAAGWCNWPSRVVGF
jgi:hypothetical protein